MVYALNAFVSVFLFFCFRGSEYVAHEWYKRDSNYRLWNDV